MEKNFNFSQAKFHFKYYGLLWVNVDLNLRNSEIWQHCGVFRQGQDSNLDVPLVFLAMRRGP